MSSCTDDDDDDDAAVGTLHIVLADVDAILARVYNIATRLALAPKPSSPILLSDLASFPPALARCTRLLHDDVHGATLVRDVRSRAKEVIDALHALVSTVTAPAGEDYLVRTAALHDLITNARSTPGIPKNNQTAVYRAWQSDRDSLEDSLQEIATMIKNAQYDNIDDGWDEIGLGHSTRMDEHELARANNIHQLLRLTNLLHKRIFLDLLAHPSTTSVSAFDALLAQSNLLLSVSDNLVSALYIPHDLTYIRAQILELAKVATTLQSQLPVFFPATDELANQLRVLSIDAATPSPPSKRKADKRWFDTCVDQITRLSSTAVESLSGAESNIA